MLENATNLPCTGAHTLGIKDLQTQLTNEGFPHGIVMNYCWIWVCIKCKEVTGQCCSYKNPLDQPNP